MMSDVTAAEESALECIRGYAAAGRISYSGHLYRDRMGRGPGTRNVLVEDVRSALVTAIRCASQKNGRWAVSGGVDLDGDELTCICVIEDDVVVITVF